MLKYTLKSVEHNLIITTKKQSRKKQKSKKTNLKRHNQINKKSNKK